MKKLNTLALSLCIFLSACISSPDSNPSETDTSIADIGDTGIQLDQSPDLTMDGGADQTPDLNDAGADTGADSGVDSDVDPCGMIDCPTTPQPVACENGNATISTGRCFEGSCETVTHDCDDASQCWDTGCVSSCCPVGMITEPIVINSSFVTDAETINAPLVVDLVEHGFCPGATLHPLTTGSFIRVVEGATSTAWGMFSTSDLYVPNALDPTPDSIVPPMGPQIDEHLDPHEFSINTVNGGQPTVLIPESARFLFVMPGYVPTSGQMENGTYNFGASCTAIQ